MASNIAARILACIVFACILLMLKKTSAHTPPFTPLPSCQNKTPIAEASAIASGEPVPDNYGLTSTAVAASGNSTKNGNGGQPVHNVELKTLIFFGGLLVILLKILCA